MISSKVGLHIIGGTRLALGKPRVVKLVNVSPEYVRQVRGLVGPDCLIVVRWSQDDQPLSGPVDCARQWFGKYKAQMLAMADNNVAFEAYNEVADSTAVSYNLFEQERLGLMHGLRLRSVVGNWSVGTPDLPLWACYRGALSTMLPNDLIGLHEYWSDYEDIANRWHCGRWTMAPEIAAKTIVVTECGRDVVEGHGLAGWQRSCGAEQFMEDLRRYGRLLDAHANVIGVTVFQVGAIDSLWRPFDATPVWPQVVSEYTSPVVPPTEAPMFPYVGKTFDWVGFSERLKGATPFPGLKYVVVHHTAIPDAATWLKYSEAYWAKHLAEYYWGQGWTAMPHVFISDRGILVENPLSLPGRGVAGHNNDAIHIETVGNFMAAPPSGPTLDNLIAACAALLKWAGLGIEGLTHHRALQTVYTDCPGDAFVNVWGAFRCQVETALNPPPPHQGLPEEEAATDPATIAQKCRWWAEEMQRQFQAGELAYAERIRLSLIQLLYRLENALKT